MTQHMHKTFVPSLYDPDLPCNNIIEVLGRPFFERLQDKLGGLEIKPPRNTAKLNADHPLVQALGYDDARRLCETMSGEQFYIPRGKKHASRHLGPVINLTRGGKTSRQIALELGISDRQVRNLRAQARHLLEPCIAAE